MFSLVASLGYLNRTGALEFSLSLLFPIILFLCLLSLPACPKCFCLRLHLCDCILSYMRCLLKNFFNSQSLSWAISKLLQACNLHSITVLFPSSCGCCQAKVWMYLMSLEYLSHQDFICLSVYTTPLSEEELKNLQQLTNFTQYKIFKKWSTK